MVTMHLMQRPTMGHDGPNGRDTAPTVEQARARLAGFRGFGRRVRGPNRIGVSFAHIDERDGIPSS